MKMYGVVISSLSLKEREAVYDLLHTHGEVHIDIFGKSGIVEAVVVCCNDNEPFPGALNIPPKCHVNEIPPGYLEAYQKNFR